MTDCFVAHTYAHVVQEGKHSEKKTVDPLYNVCLVK